LFDYLAVLLSVILSLALAYLALGFGSLIQMRRSVRPYWVQIIWSIAAILYIVGFWWDAFRWRHLADWEIYEFLFLIGSAVAIFLMSSLLFPQNISDGLRFEKHFFDNRQWFFGLLGLALILEGLAKVSAGMQTLRLDYLLFLPFALALAALGWATSDPRVHRIIAPAFVVVQAGYLLSGLFERIAAV